MTRLHKPVLSLVLVAAMDAAGLVLQRTGATHAPLAVSVLTAVTGCLVLLGAYGVARNRPWGWEVAVGSTLVTAAIAAAALLQGLPAVKTTVAALGLIIAVAGLSILLPLRRSRAHA